MFVALTQRCAVLCVTAARNESSIDCRPQQASLAENCTMSRIVLVVCATTRITALTLLLFTMLIIFMASIVQWIVMECEVLGSIPFKGQLTNVNSVYHNKSQPVMQFKLVSVGTYIQFLLTGFGFCIEKVRGLFGIAYCFLHVTISCLYVLMWNQYFFLLLSFSLLSIAGSLTTHKRRNAKSFSVLLSKGLEIFSLQ